MHPTTKPPSCPPRPCCAGAVALLPLLLVAGVLVSGSLHAQDPVKEHDRDPAKDLGKGSAIAVRVTGLFSPDRVDDLRETMKQLPDVRLIAVDYPTAQATFNVSSSEPFINAKPEQIPERLDNLLRSVSRSTFGIRPLCEIPRDKLSVVEIAVAGLDCKGCCLGAYEAIYRIEGVEQATASFKEGRVTAWIDGDKTNRMALEEALKKRGVQLAEDRE
jgi:hypothetical protein